jgi:myo-inositol-1(or 4)-monophosphatase
MSDIKIAPVPELLMPSVRAIVAEAGALAMAHFRQDRQTSARIWQKSGGSPVTEADIAVDTFLKIRLTMLMGEAGWLSEETADDPAGRAGRHVWVVDPIDGTRAFMSGSPDWAVCVALLDDGKPVLGVVEAPAHGKTYHAVAGRGACINDAAIGVSARAELADALVAGPQPLVDRAARDVALRRADKVPSLALRLARVADGSLDAGLVSPDARDWDIAAADLILSEAGGQLSTHRGERPVYNAKVPVHGVLVASNGALHAPLLAALASRVGVPSAERG